MIKYRPEIDGLRAIAVVPVVLFHAGAPGFEGGFVGVDVFFVISGFLITSILVSDIEQGKFGILSFYERRARRLLPALFLVIVCCVPFAWAWMSASQFLDFGKSLVATSLFSSNILFWRQSDYFSAAAEEKPLLHTWSLAVEEQFYILFPVFLVLSLRFGRNSTFWMIAALGMFSLVLAEWGGKVHSAANFYLLPTRAWELLAGSLASLYLARHDTKSNTLFAGLGLIGILASITLFDSSTPTPSLVLALPVLGTVLVILYAKETVVSKILGLQPFVGIGLISYSAYLWHQPLLAFARVRAEQHPSLLLLLFLAFISFPLAYLSWRFVETPFRSRKMISRRGIIKLSVIAILLPMFIGVVTVQNRGFPITDELVISLPSEAPAIDQDIIVIGDSHGGHLIPGLTAVTRGRVFDYTSPGCIPFRNVDRFDSRFRPGDCAKLMNANLDRVLADDPEALVVVSSMGPVYIDGTTFRGHDPARVRGLGVELITNPEIVDRRKVFELGLRRTLKEFSRLNRARVYVAIDVPELGIKNGCQVQNKRIIVGDVVLRDLLPSPRSKAESCWIPRAEYEARTLEYRSLVREVVSEFPKIKLFDPTEHFCDSNICKGYHENYQFLYRDADHLSSAGSVFFANEFARQVTQGALN